MIDIKKPTMLSIKEASEMFGLPQNLIRAKAKSGEIVAIRSNSKYYINAEKFCEYLQTHREPACEPEPIKPAVKEGSVVLGIRPIPLRL